MNIQQPYLIKYKKKYLSKYKIFYYGKNQNSSILGFNEHTSYIYSDILFILKLSYENYNIQSKEECIVYIVKQKYNYFIIGQYMNLSGEILWGIHTTHDKLVSNLYEKYKNIF